MDKALLEYEMKTKGVSINQMCHLLGLSRSAFYRKTTGRSQFTLDEIKRICKILELKSPVAIFFADKVS